MAERDKEMSVEDSGGGNINQIRDILVGPFQRQQEARVDALERSVARNEKDAASAGKRLEEKLLKKIDATSEKLSAKIEGLSKSLKELGKTQKSEMDALGKDLAKQIEQLHVKLAAEISDLERLTEERLAALRHDLDSQVARLNEEKTGREDLGDYLVELGLRLKGEASLASIESSLKDAVGGDAHS